MMRQADLDMQAEDAKALLPPSITLEMAFSTLDRFHKGYITDSDLSQYSQDFGGSAHYLMYSNLVHEVHLRRPRAPTTLPGRLTLRDLGTLILPLGSQEHEATLAASSDAEARSILHLLRHSEPYPRSSIRVQRDADSAGCPNVKLDVSAQYHLYRMLGAAAVVAEQLEQGRKHLSFSSLSEGGIGLCSSAFAFISDGQMSFLMGDLRRAFFNVDIMISEQQLGLLWRRYAAPGSQEVNFMEFARQLKPRES
jgi:hypothetical protein